MVKINTKKISGFLAVIGLLIFLHFIRALNPIENIFVRTLNPIVSGFYSMGSNLKIEYKKQNDKRDLVKLTEEQDEQIKNLIVENARLKSLEDENRKLRQHLKFSIDSKHKYILANVTSMGIFEESDDDKQAIIINRGSDDGLSEGLAIVDSHGIVVGKIAQIRKNTAKAYLTTNKNCKLAVSIQNNARTVGVTEGDLGLTIKMNFIPQTEEVKIGDNIITSGLNNNIPSGLVVGKVKKVEQDSNDVWQHAVIEPLVDLNSLIIVSVLLP